MLEGNIKWKEPLVYDILEKKKKKKWEKVFGIKLGEECLTKIV